MSMKDVVLRPTVKDQRVIDAVAREIVGNMTNRGGFSADIATQHVAHVIAEKWFEDGYQMTKLLEQKFGWFNCDMGVAEAMDITYPLLLAEVRKQTEAWVLNNAIKPRKSVGDKVHFNYRSHEVDGEIVSILHHHAQYIVNVPEEGCVRPGHALHENSGQDGIPVNFENLHDLVAPPEEFELVVQK